ncbi:MAG: RNA 2'-phosphotransferase [Arenimonas sp.]
MNSEKSITSTSKFLSLILRHTPEKIGLILDNEGWARIEDIIRLSRAHGTQLNLELIQTVVATNDKKRFAISDDGACIRANQGHSLANIDLNMQRVDPPEFLFHGTATRFIDSIRTTGLTPESRNHVHLSQDHETAVRVGTRHGNPIVLVVRALMMHKAGFSYYRSENGVWLTDNVPTMFIDFPAG